MAHQAHRIAADSPRRLAGRSAHAAMPEIVRWWSPLTVAATGFVGLAAGVPGCVRAAAIEAAHVATPFPSTVNDPCDNCAARPV